MVSEPQDWRVGWLPENFDRGVVPGLYLMVPLVAMWRLSCRVVRIEVWRLVGSLFSRGEW